MKKFIILSFILLAIGALAFYIYISVDTRSQREKIVELEKSIAKLKEEMIPLRFKVLDNSDGKIKVALKLYDCSGNVIKKIEHELEGQELCFDFYTILVKDKYIAFPNKLYTNKIPPANGISLVNEYDNEGFPQIFYSDDLTPDLREGLTILFDKVKKGKTDSIQTMFGNMVHDFKQFGAFVPKQVYKITSHSKGGLEVVEEQ